MASYTELDNVAAQDRLQLDAALTELPRAHRMKTADVGIEESSYASIASGYAAGDETNKDLCERFLQVFLEMMSRTPNAGPRIKQDAMGNVEKGPNGGPLAKQCSMWAMDYDDCHSASTNAKLAPRPEPGHWKTFVTENWRQIMPRLVFASAVANPGLSASALDYNAETWKKTWEAAFADTNEDRKKLIGWLVPFLKHPVCKWDGRK